MQIGVLGLPFYLLSNLLVASALGILATKLRFSAIPKTALFFAGAAVTPYVYGNLTLLLLLLPLRLPAFVYTLLPALLALVVIVLNRNLVQRLTALVRAVSPEAKATLFAAVALLPVLSVSADLNAVLLAKSGGFLIILSAICGFAFALLELPLQKRIWQPLRRTARVGLFVLCGLFVATGIFLSLRSGFGATLRDSLLAAGVSLAGIGVLTALLWLLLRRAIRLERAVACRVTATYAIVGAGLVLLRLFAHSFTLALSNTNQRIAVTTALMALVVGLVFLALYLVERVLRKAKDEPPVRGAFEAFIKKATRSALLLFSAVALLTVGMTIGARAAAPVTGADAMEYMTAAYEIANERTLDSVAGYNSSASGSQIGIVHHPAWTTYLAQALMHGAEEPFAYPNDLAARATYALTYVYLFIAVFALARAFLPTRFALFASALAACTPQLGFILSINSREGFRIIPIMVFILVLFGYARALSKERRVLWPELFAVFLTAAFTMMGHVLNGIPAVAIAVSIVLFCILTRNFRIGTIWMGLSALLGGVFGCIQILLGYLERGQLLSEFISLDYMLAGTPYLSNFNAYQVGRLGDTTNYLERLNVLIRYDHGVLTFVGAAFGVVFVVLMIAAAKKRKPAELSGLLGLIGIFYALLFTDIFSWSGYTLSEWSVMNIRYLSHLYPLYAVLVAGGLYLLNRIRLKSALLGLAVSATVCVYAAYPGAKVGVTYPLETLYAGCADMAQLYSTAHRDHEGSGGRILLDNYYCNYYFNCEGMTIFSDTANEIRRASTLPALRAALERENIDAILITEEFISVYWQNTILLELVSSNDYRMSDYGYFKVYEKVNTSSY